MKFKTQHIQVFDNGDDYLLHRDGNTTWKTRTGKAGQINNFDIINHATMSAAKAVLGSITSRRKF